MFCSRLDGAAAGGAAFAPVAGVYGVGDRGAGAGDRRGDGDLQRGVRGDAGAVWV